MYLLIAWDGLLLRLTIKTANDGVFRKRFSFFSQRPFDSKMANRMS
jgi:hypothetical protein